MGKKIPTDNAEKSRRLIVESLRVQKHFTFLHPRIVGDRLVCRGTMQPTATSPAYRMEVVYKPWLPPEVRILHPEIKQESRLHIYRNGTLCLYDWRQQPWQKRWNLADTIIPWTAEWLLYYEIYKLTGKWSGRTALHDATKGPEPTVGPDGEQKVQFA
jgi:hypothetical protein